MAQTEKKEVTCPRCNGACGEYRMVYMAGEAERKRVWIDCIRCLGTGKIFK